MLARFLADALPLWSLNLLADALPSLLLDARSLDGCFATWPGLLCRKPLCYCLLQAQLLSRVLRAVALSLMYLLLFLCLFQVTYYYISGL